MWNSVDEDFSLCRIVFLKPPLGKGKVVFNFVRNRVIGVFVLDLWQESYCWVDITLSFGNHRSLTLENSVFFWEDVTPILNFLNSKLTNFLALGVGQFGKFSADMLQNSFGFGDRCRFE